MVHPHMLHKDIVSVDVKSVKVKHDVKSNEVNDGVKPDEVNNDVTLSARTVFV